MDTDVELLKPLDEFLDYTAYFAFESSLYINSGKGFGAEKGTQLIYDMLMVYDARPLHRKKEQRQELCTHINTAFLKQALPAFRTNNTFQVIDNIAFLPFEYVDVYLKHYNSLSWADEQPIRKRKHWNVTKKLINWMRKPEKIEWVDTRMGERAKNVYVFVAYDLFDTDMNYFLSRIRNKFH